MSREESVVVQDNDEFIQYLTGVPTSIGKSFLLFQSKVQVQQRSLIRSNLQKIEGDFGRHIGFI